MSKSTWLPIGHAAVHYCRRTWEQATTCTPNHSCRLPASSTIRAAAQASEITATTATRTRIKATARVATASAVVSTTSSTTAASSDCGRCLGQCMTLHRPAPGAGSRLPTTGLAGGAEKIGGAAESFAARCLLRSCVMRFVLLIASIRCEGSSESSASLMCL